MIISQLSVAAFLLILYVSFFSIIKHTVWSPQGVSSDGGAC